MAQAYTELVDQAVACSVAANELKDETEQVKSESAPAAAVVTVKSASEMVQQLSDERALSAYISSFNNPAPYDNGCHTKPGLRVRHETCFIMPVDRMYHILSFMNPSSRKAISQFENDSWLNKLLNNRDTVITADLYYCPIKMIDVIDGRPHSDRADSYARDSKMVVCQPVVVVRTSGGDTYTVLSDVHMDWGWGFIWNDSPSEVISKRVPMLDLGVEFIRPTDVELESIDQNSLLFSTIKSGGGGMIIFQLQYISLYALNEFRSRRTMLAPGLKPELSIQRLVRAYSEDPTVDAFSSIKLAHGVDVMLQSARMIGFLLSGDPTTPLTAF
jgi:hypothetical protein